MEHETLYSLYISGEVLFRLGTFDAYSLPLYLCLHQIKSYHYANSF